MMGDSSGDAALRLSQLPHFDGIARHSTARHGADSRTSSGSRNEKTVEVSREVIQRSAAEHASGVDRLLEVCADLR